MTTLQTTQLNCPCCTRAFSSKKVCSTNSFGGKRTDFHERAAGTQPLPYYVHVCPGCGYVGAEHDFVELTGAVGPALRTRILDETRRQGIPQTGSERYERAAKIATWREDGLRLVADCWLRAAWCAVDEGDVEAERYYRRLAARAFTDALQQFDGIAREERAVITYLVGELWRRIGDTKMARGWFDQVPAEVVDHATQQWVIDAACQQRDCPREWFG